MSQSSKCNGSQLIFNLGKKQRKIVRRYLKTKKLLNTDEKVNDLCRDIGKVNGILNKEIEILNNFSNISKVIKPKTSVKKEKKTEVKTVAKTKKKVKFNISPNSKNKNKITNKKSINTKKTVNKKINKKINKVDLKSKLVALSDNIHYSGHSFFNKFKDKNKDRDIKIKEYYAEKGLVYINELGDGHCLYRSLLRLQKNDVLKEQTITIKEIMDLRKELADYLQDKVFNHRKDNEDLILSIFSEIQDAAKGRHQDVFDEMSRRGKVSNNLIDVDLNLYSELELDQILIHFIDKKRNNDWGSENEIDAWCEINKKCIHYFYDDNNIENFKKGNYISESIIRGIKYKKKSDSKIYGIHYHNNNHYGSVQHISNLPDNKLKRIKYN